MAYTTTDLIPRSVNKRKSSQTPAGPSRITKPAFAFQEPRRATPIPETEEYQDQLISLVTCAITECSVSEDFKIRLRTPQGFIEVGALQQQLCTRKRYSPAAIAMALSKVPEMYKVRLARVRTPGNPRPFADHRQAMSIASDGLQGGGFEFQFLDGQQRARRTEDLLAASAVVLENVPPRYSYGLEGVVELLLGLDRKLVNPRTLLGIGRISASTSDTGHSISYPMRHVVVVFGSEEAARSILATISKKTATLEQDSSSVMEYLVPRGFKARSIHEVQTLRAEYLELQNSARQTALLAQESQSSAPLDHHAATPATTTKQLEEEEVNDPYPLDCLIFLQNLPDNTNKTEIKAKLDVFLDGGKVDYVDWKKGQISAHVRVVRPAHAQMIIQGLDAENDGESMKAELLTGSREKLYWMKLPEKIRIAALHAQS